MKNFKGLMYGDIKHIKEELTAAAETAEKLLFSFHSPITNDKLTEDKKLERKLAVQLTHLRGYLNGMWAEDDGPPEAIDEVGEGPRRIRILLETKDIAVVGNMAALIHSNAKEAIEDLDGSRYMFPETEAAAEALFLFLRNRVK